MKDKEKRNYKVIDGVHARTKSYIGMVFFPHERIRNAISIWNWLLLTVVEIIVGAELIESIVTTGSVKPYGKTQKEDSSKYGAELHLTLHIPAGFITNLLRPLIIELLYYKFYYQYLLLLPIGEPEINDKKKIIDCTRTRFRARKEVFYQLIALRRVYDFSWIIINVLIDILVYYFSNSIEWALVSAMTIEAIRRLLKV